MLETTRTFVLFFLLVRVISAEIILMLARFCFSLGKLETEKVGTLDSERKGRNEGTSIWGIQKPRIFTKLLIQKN